MKLEPDTARFKPLVLSVVSTANCVDSGSLNENLTTSCVSLRLLPGDTKGEEDAKEGLLKVPFSPSSDIWKGREE